MTTIEHKTLCNIIRQNGDRIFIDHLDCIYGRDATQERSGAAMAGYIIYTQGRIELTEKGKKLLQ